MTCNVLTELFLQTDEASQQGTKTQGVTKKEEKGKMMDYE